MKLKYSYDQMSTPPYFNLKTHKMVKKTLHNQPFTTKNMQKAKTDTHILKLYPQHIQRDLKENLNNYTKFFQYTFNNGINWFKKALKTILNKQTTTKT